MAEKVSQVKSRSVVRAVVDRIEDNGLAVLLLGEEEKVSVDIPVALLPEGVGGGDHLRVTFSLDRDSRAETEKRIEQLRQQLESQSNKQGQKDFNL